MRKLFTIALVVILASAVSVVGFGNPPEWAQNPGNEVKTSSDQANATFSVNSSISLSITDGEQVQFGDLNPGDNKTINEGTMLKVVANNNLEWEVQASKSGGNNTPVEAVDALTVGMNGNTGTGESSDISATYNLNLPETMPSGTHTVIVTFTAYAK